MMLASFMDALSVSWDAQNIATLAHCDAVRRGHPLHQSDPSKMSCDSQIGKRRLEFAYPFIRDQSVVGHTVRLLCWPPTRLILSTNRRPALLGLAHCKHRPIGDNSAAGKYGDRPELLQDKFTLGRSQER